MGDETVSENQVTTVEIVDVEGEEDLSVLSDEVIALLDDAAAELGRVFANEPFSLRARDAEGRMVGGLAGFSTQGWFFVKLLAVSPDVRGTGVGHRLLQRAEEHARAEGLAGVYLDTYEFQAPVFYARQGYSEIGRLPAVGDAPQRIWFAKPFQVEG